MVVIRFGHDYDKTSATHNATAQREATMNRTPTVDWLNHSLIYSGCVFVCVCSCMGQDEVLFSLAEDVKNFAVVYLVDITEVPDFCSMYELYDPCTTMFFFRNKVRSNALRVQSASLLCAGFRVASSAAAACAIAPMRAPS